MLQTLFGLFKGPIAKIGDQIVQAKKDAADAKNDSERIALEGRIADLEAKKAIILSEQSNWYTAMIRPLFALPFVIYNFKLVVWDKVLGLGATDPLSPELLKIEMIVIGAYFLGRTGEKIVRTLKR